MKAYKVKLGVDADVGRGTAQMMAVPDCVPFEETDVRKPGAWIDAGKVAAPSRTNGVLIAVLTLQVFSSLPWLVTTRPIPSDPAKYEGPHQHSPSWISLGLFGPPATYPPISPGLRFMMYRRPYFAAATTLASGRSTVNVKTAEAAVLERLVPGGFRTYRGYEEKEGADRAPVASLSERSFAWSRGARERRTRPGASAGGADAQGKRRETSVQ